MIDNLPEEGKSMKRFVFMTVLAGLIAGGLFAQEGPKNWVYGQGGLIGGGVGYERLLSSSLSVGGELYYNSFFIIWNSFATEAYARYYPLQAQTLYFKLGLGFGTVTGTEDYEYSYGGVTVNLPNRAYATRGFLIDPGVGWKIDVGQPGKFYIEPKASLAIVLGKKDYGLTYGGYEAEFKLGINPVLAFAVGYAF
jgi:hypothetical protein